MKGYAEGDEGGRRGRHLELDARNKKGGGRRVLFRRLAGILNAQVSKLCSEVGCDFCGYTCKNSIINIYLFHLVLFS